MPFDGPLAPEVLRQRAAWRRQVQAGPWFPLVHLDPAFRPTADQVADAARQAAGGWLYLGPGEVPEPLSTEARAAAARTGARLVLDQGPPPTDAEARQLAWEDQHHLAASDPSLARQRQALRSLCARGETVLLLGPLGSGRRSLARQVHAALANEPLVELVGEGAGIHPPGRWILLADLSATQLPTLAALMEEGARRGSPSLPPQRRGVRPEHPAFRPLVGQDPALCELLRRAELHAPHPHPILILGETGAGKELLARALHEASGRRGPLVSVDLGSLDPELAGSTLFGHRRGSYTGAEREREGAFRRAHGGTLLLDELANLPLPLQARLLRVLETGEVHPLGSDRPEQVDVRILAATNEEPEVLVREGRFRRDLLHRLDAVVFRLPPLRERLEDLPELARTLLGPLGAALPSPEALALLMEQPWPGNVRQLRNVLAAAAIEARGRPLGPEAFGALRPARRPLLVTSTDEDLDRLPLDRRARQDLEALTLRVPALAERGEAALRHVILSGLGGRPISQEALERLLAWPWWGHGLELARKLAALRRALPGPVDLPALLQVFPELERVQRRLPICLLLHPVPRGSGEVRGLRSDHHAAAVLIGRASERPRPSGEDPRARWIQGRVGDGEVEVVPFPHLPELSRLHLLIARGPQGLVIHRAPQTALAVEAGPLGSTPALLPQGGAVELGEAADIRVLREGDRPYLQLFAFLGPEALDRAAEALRRSATGQFAGPTLHDLVERRQAWTLDAEEVEVLVEVLVDASQRGLSVAPALRAGLAGRSEAAGRSLAAYVDGPHPTQAVVRLFELPGNGRLRSALAQALGTRAIDPATLPKGIARALNGA